MLAKFAPVEATQPRCFDVVCAGEALWHLAQGESASPAGPSLRFRPGGGALGTAVGLARRGLRVGLCTSLADDRFGRALRARVAAAGVDVEAVTLAPPSSGLVVLDGGGAARPVVSYRDEEQPAVVPAGWQSQVLLLSGISPVVANAASFCKAARAARRAGTAVVLDLNARWHVWAGRDPRAVRMVLREADVVHGSAEDLAALGVDAAALRASMRELAVLVVSDATGGAWAAGPFGETRRAAPPSSSSRPERRNEVYAASICFELARTAGASERGEIWDRALDAGLRASAVSR